MGAVWSYFVKRSRSATIEINRDGSINFSPPVFPFTQTFEGVAAALDYCPELTKVTIRWEVGPGNVNFRLMLKWIKVAMKLHALPALKSIEVNVKGLKYPFVDMFLDSLPDKVTDLTTGDVRPATLLRKRKCQLKSVCFGAREKEHAYLADIFRLKTPRIELSAASSNPTRLLYQLHDCGPLGPNDHLQELRIWASIAMDNVIPQIFRRLRAINAHFNLIWNDFKHVSLSGSSDLKQVEDIQTALMEFATTMGDAGFRAKDDVLELSIRALEDWKHLYRDRVIERLGWKRITPVESTALEQKCSLVHNGVRIVMSVW